MARSATHTKMGKRREGMCGAQGIRRNRGDGDSLRLQGLAFRAWSSTSSRRCITGLSLIEMGDRAWRGRRLMNILRHRRNRVFDSAMPALPSPRRVMWEGQIGKGSDAQDILDGQPAMTDGDERSSRLDDFARHLDREFATAKLGELIGEVMLGCARQDGLCQE